MSEQEFNLIFASREKQLRKEANMTQKQLADKLGVTRTCVANWETGARAPQKDIIAKLSVMFGVSADYLFGRTEERHKIYTPPVREMDFSLLNSLGMSRMIEYFELLRSNPRFTSQQ